MKILHSCYQSPDTIINYMALPNYINCAVQQLGHELITFDDRDFILPGRLLSAVPFFEEIELRRLNNKLISLVEKERPDICVLTGGHRIFPKTALQIKELGCVPILWTTDAPRNFTPIIELARCCDHIFCAGTEAIELLEERGITRAQWLPFACDHAIHVQQERPRGEIEKEYDIVFVGSWYPNRARLLEELTDFDIAVWGPGWKYLESHSLLKQYVRGGPLGPDEWIDIYNRAKIVLVAHFQHEDIPCYQASPKVYEALACRAFVLCDAQKDVRSLFCDGTHLAIFEDADDLRGKVKYYLEHDDEREQIAQRGYAEVIARHTYVDRVEELLSKISLPVHA